MRSAVKDILFIGTCLLVIVLASVLLYADLNRDLDRSVTEQIGSITFKKRLAERKFTSQVLWGRIENNSPIYNYDTIRTDDESLAIIYLNDGTEIELNSNTLIVLSMKEKLLDIKLEGGVLSAEKSSKGGTATADSAVRISSGGSNIEMTEGGMTVAKDLSEGVNVNVSAGSVSVSSSGKDTLLGANQSASINSEGAKLSQTAYTAEAPGASSVFLTSEDKLSVNFRWSGGSASGMKSVVISKDPFLKKSSVEFKSQSGNALTASILPGTYFWKVKGSDGDSSVLNFTIIQDSPARQISPGSGEKFQYAGNLPMINFRWGTTPYSGSYIVEVFSDERLTVKAGSFAGRGSSIASNTLKEGRYFWRIKNVYGRNIDAGEIVSPVRYFDIVKIDTVLPPVLTGGKTGTLVSGFALQQGRETLKWTPSPGADQYEVEISADSEFKNIISSRKTKFNYSIPPAGLKSGKYFWRVSSIAGEKKSAPSEESVFIVDFSLKIENVTPPNGTTISSEKKNLNFVWNDFNKGNNYLLEISGKEDFSDTVINRKIFSSRLDLPMPDPGKYFWRVHLLGSSGEKITSGSAWSFNVFKINAPPEIISPVQNSAVDLLKVKEIVLKWKGDKDSTHYQLLVYNNTSGIKNTVYSGIVKKPEYSISALSGMRETDYFWEITGLRNEKGEYIPSTRVSRGNFKVILGKRVTVPEIRISPVVVVK
jgi:hypothetical protein